MPTQITTDFLENSSNNDLLVLLLTTSISKEKKILLQEVKCRIKNGTMIDPVYQFMLTTKSFSTASRQLSKVITGGCKLFKNAMTYKDMANYENKDTSDDTKDLVESRVALLCFAIENVYGYSKLKSIDISSWEAIVGELKNSDDRYKDGLTEPHKQSARTLALLLITCNKNHSYKPVTINKRLNSKSGGSSHSVQANAEIAMWYEMFSEYLETLHLKNTKQYWAAFNVFMGYIKKYNLSFDPRKFLSTPNNITFWDYLVEERSSNPKYKLTIIYDSTNWIIEEYMTDRDGEEITTIGIPILSTHRYNHVLKSDTKQPSKPVESVKLAPPTSWLFIIRDILCEDNFKWPKTVTKDYFKFHNEETNSFENVWVPVNAYIFLTMLEVPLRKIQVISSDSGEGDTHKFNIAKKAWEKNTSVHANYWKKLGARRVNRGIVSILPSTDPSFAGLYINTNKTQDIDSGFSETSGYNVPWYNEILTGYLSDLRAWQEKYNPVVTPTKYRTIASSVFQSTPTQSVLDAIPDRFYLFRHPKSNRGNHPDSPPTSNQINGFWMLLMEELEKRVNQMGESAEIITHYNEKTKQPDASIFTPHGLRVAGLTAFAEAGVPIEILSKIVAGHSSILNTIYYLKYNAAHITDILNEAQKNTELNAQKNYQKWLKDASWEEAKRYAAYNSTDGLSFAVNSDASSSVWGGSSLGICPYGGTRCNDGGEVIRRNASNNKTHLYSSVSGGQGNCVRCRHFITGAPWLIPLWLHGNSLLSQSSKKSVEIDALKSKQTELCSTRYSLMKEGSVIPPELAKEINTHDSIIEKKVKALDEILMNAHATYNLLEKIRAIASSESSDDSATLNSKPLALVSDNSDIGFTETTRFVALDTLVQAGRIYTHIQDTDEERERNNFIDQILFNNSINPISFSPLSDKEKSFASDAAAKFLISRLESDEIENLHDGCVTLDSLGISSELEKTLTLVNEARIPNVLPHTNSAKLENS